jgi:hypothetical protein
VSSLKSRVAVAEVWEEVQKTNGRGTSAIGSRYHSNGEEMEKTQYMLE